MPLLPLGMDDAWLVPALSLLAFATIAIALLLSLARYLPGRGAYLSIGAIGLGFVISWPVMRELLASGRAEYSVTWFQVGEHSLSLGMIVDPLSVLMLGLVSFVALAVQVYSLGYMHGDPRFSWYFAAHSLFAAAMLGLVLADNFLLLYITWELVGLCSYLLIGHYYDRRSAAEAAKKAFVTTRLGDVGLLIGILLLFRETGTFQMSTIFQAAQRGEIEAGIVTVATLLIFMGAMGKSAQFPFHVWLPDAMEGPTPVSALIHAATMVTAGVYLVARTYPLFVASELAMQVVTIIGLVTALMAASMALVMTDLKRIIAYSTVSKLGLMMVALGSGGLGFTAGIFYLLTHGFFKALLFLGAGSIIHSTGKTDITEMGGLGRRMPWTMLTFVVAALALAGLPPLSGFWSKDEVLIAVREGQHPIVYGLTLVAVLLSALYIARPCFLVFFGPLRQELEHAHEAPAVMLVPMLALGVLAMVSGLVALPAVGGAVGLGGGLGSFLYFGEAEAYHFDGGVAALSSGIALGGIVVAACFYYWRIWSAEALARRLVPLVTLLRNKYYIDDLYQAVIDRVVMTFSGLIALFDRTVVNDIGVNGSGRLTVMAGAVLKYHETGKLYNYGLGIVVGIALIVVFAAPFVL